MIGHFEQFVAARNHQRRAVFFSEVIEKERAKLAEAEQALAKLVEQREKIANL